MTAIPGPAEDLLSAPSIFRRQTLVLAVILPISAFGVASSTGAPGPVFWSACAVLLGITGACALPFVPRLSPTWLGLVLLADIPAIAALGAEDRGLATWVVLVIPVTWLARSYGARASLLGLLTAAASLAAAGVWAHAAHGVPVAIIVGVGLTTLVVAVTLSALSLSARTTMVAQSDLLQRQARMLEAALAEARNRRRDIQAVLDTVDFAVVSIAPGQQPDLNVTARRLLQRLGIAESVPTDRLPLYEIDGNTPLRRESYRALISGEIDELPLWLGHVGSTRVALSITANRDPASQQDHPRIVLTARDITDERAAINARDDMIASLSHELRTPMSSVIGYIDLVLEDTRLAEGHRHALGVALKNSDRVLRLVSDLAQARSEAATPGFTVSMTQCDVARVVEESLQSVHPQAADRMLTVSVDAPASLVIEADPFRLRNVVDNLLSNAVKYNDIGGWIDVVLAEDDADAVLIVSNTGPTLSADEVARLFDRFYRAPASRQSTTHGTGIGLSVAKEIVELHGGTISVESSADIGATTFTVVLPRVATPPVAGPRDPVRHPAPPIDGATAVDDADPTTEPHEVRR